MTTRLQTGAVTAAESPAPRISRNIAWSYAQWSISIIGPLITIPFYVRLLGHELYGQWLVILSLTSYLGLANLGMGQTVANRIAEAVARGRRDAVSAIVSTAFFAYGAIGLALFGAICAIAPWMGRRYFNHSSVAAEAFALYAGLSALSFPLKVHQMALRGYQRVDRERAIEAGAAAARLAIIIAALSAGMRLLAVAFINGGSALLAAAIAYVNALALDAGTRPRLARFSLPLLRGMVKPSAAFLSLQVGLALIMGIDNLVIGYALGGSGVTRYAVSMRLMWMGAGLFSVAIGALTPTVTASHARNRGDLITRGFLLSMRLGILYAAAGAVMLWLAGPAFIRLWAGPGVLPDRATYALQIAFFMLTVWVSPAATVLWATTRHYRWAAVTMFEGVLNLALSLWGVRHFGLAGVIGATIAASLLTNAWYIPASAAALLGITPMRAAAEIGPGLALAAAAIAATFALAPGYGAGPGAVALAAAIGLPIFAAAYLRVAFSKSEREIFLGWVGRHIAAA
jgi:O-antigen/teichoic acid export membrane protein